ncbi:hypothetical protein [Bacillus sp. JJ1474]|uniref:hypothetical protein n=1 Tax=Bacillus sp. JJ1474 TaxID=3122955 RepID=UPI002FFD605E
MSNSEEVIRLRKIIAELKEKTRFKNYLKIAEENLALEEGLRRTIEQRDHYKKQYETLLQAHEALKKAI